MHVGYRIAFSVRYDEGLSQLLAAGSATLEPAYTSIIPGKSPYPRHPGQVDIDGMREEFMALGLTIKPSITSRTVPTDT
jgi:hypothetical protein